MKVSHDEFLFVLFPRVYLGSANLISITNLTDAQNFARELASGSFKNIVALTGAGISTESGIPDFRSPGGIWSRRQPVQYNDFISSEKSRLEDWERRFEMQAFFSTAEPNSAHFALTKLAQKHFLSCLITQNVDGLHQKSGFPLERLIEIHGNSTFATCLDCGSREELDDLRATFEKAETPRCKKCNGLLKAAVVSFGQAMPEKELDKAVQAASVCDLFIVLGSSLVVQPAAQLPVIAVHSGAELVILNAEETPLDSLASTVIRTPLAQTFSKFLEE